MKLHLAIAIALGLSLTAACKKDEKKDDDKADKGTAQPDKPVVTVDASAAPVATVDAATVAPDDGLKLTWKVPAVGSVTTKVEEGTTDATLTMKGQEVQAQFVDHETRHVKVLEATDVISKVEAHFEVKHQLQRSGGKEEKKPSPLEGKKYVVWVEGGAIKATRDDGAAVDAKELEELTDAFDDDLGRVRGIVQVLTSRAWKPNEEVTLGEQERQALAADLKKGATVTDGTVTLEKVDGGTAVFRLRMGIDAKAELTGKMTSDVTATIDLEHLRPVNIDIKGTMDVTVKDMPMKGTMAGTERYTYQ